MKKKTRNLFKLQKENEAIKDRTIRDIRTAFEQQEEDYYKLVRVENFWNKNYIEYESNGDRNKHLSVKQYLKKIKPYLRGIIIGILQSDAWNIQLKIAINIISSKNVNEGRVRHSKSNNIEFTTYSNAKEVVNELFESPLLRYQIGIETSVTRRNFILIQFSCCITNATRTILNVAVKILTL